MISSDTPSGKHQRLPLKNHVDSLPFLLVNGIGLGGVTGIVVFLDWKNGILAAVLYYVRMFFVTGFAHRYFSHRSIKLLVWPRQVQFVMALLFTTCTQKGALWWAAHHRHHHAYSDKPEDIHSNFIDGFRWSHLGWVISGKYDTVDYDEIKDLSRYPELMWLEKPLGYLIMPTLLALACYWYGGFVGLVEIFFGSTFLLYHGTFCINSLSHMFGDRRFKTDEESRNNVWLNLLTLGEGWHNNHHNKPIAASQAITPEEERTDITYQVFLSWERTGMIKILYKYTPGDVDQARKESEDRKREKEKEKEDQLALRS